MKAEDFVTIEKRDGVAILWIDHKLEPENIVAPVVIELLEEVVDEFLNDPEVVAGVLISKKNNFIAGADIKAFEIEKEGDFRPYQEKGHRILDRLEKSGKPMVAAIHGACMGLGTELSLACSARIASSDPATKFALPEVQLGLLPGGGGTQRLPRVIGIQKALDMMLTGRNIYAYQARKWGLVRSVVHKNKLLQAATMLALRLKDGKGVRARKKSLPDRVLEDTPAGRSILFNQAKKRALKKSRGNYPAIPAILDCVETGYKKGIKAGYDKELALFEWLMLTQESKALRSLFFAMRKNKKTSYDPEAIDVSQVGIVGAGYMGRGIAEVSVTHDMEVRLRDVHADSLTQARKDLWKTIKKKVKYKALTKIESEEVMGRLHTSEHYDQFEQVQLVIEAVPEKMAIKASVVEELQQVIPEEAIVATNTSSLSVTELADRSQMQERVIGMHYFSPVPKMPLLEIVTTPYTTPAVIDTCYKVGKKQGKTCIVVKDSPGFYVNRMLAPYMNEALLLLDDGASIETIDRVFLDAGFPMGPLTLYDQVGLDVAASTAKTMERVMQDRPEVEVHPGVIRMFEAGRLGKKNKLGFYRYDKKTGKRVSSDKEAYAFFKREDKGVLSDEDIRNRGLYLLLNEAVMCLDEQIIDSPQDGDLGAVMGIGFLPFTGGPFRYIDQLGTANVVATMQTLQERYGDRFTPCPRLTTMAQTNTPFHKAPSNPAHDPQPDTSHISGD